MIAGTLAALRRYPVKSLRAQPLESAEITTAGVAGDREAAMVVSDGHERAGKTYRGKENERLHLTGDPEAARVLAAERGVAVETRRGGRYFDAAPISLVLDRWIDELAALLGYALEWERFRPNLFVRAAGAFAPPESELSGAELRLGGTRLRVRCAIERCVAITYHPEDEPGDLNVLRVLAQQRANRMGVYCDVVEPGIVRVGEELELL